MPKQFFENTTKSPKSYYGVTLQPGEQKWIEVPPPPPPPELQLVKQDPISKKLYGANGEEVSPVSGAVISTWANRASLVAANSFSAFFTDVGVGGSFWDYSGGRWRPSARSVVLYNGLTPVTLNNGTKTVVDYAQVLAGLMQDGDILEYAFLVEKDGLATDVYTIDVCAGAAAATVGTSLGLSTGGLASGQKQLSPAPIRVRRESATSLRPVSVGGANATGANTGANTAVTVPSLDSAWFLQLAAQRTTGTTEVLTSRHLMVTLWAGA